MQNDNLIGNHADMVYNAETSLSVIVTCNEDTKSINACLGSIKDLADQVIVVNATEDCNITGLSNKLQGIESYNCNQALGQSYIKNYGLRKARCSWILMLDGNEIIEKRYNNIFGSMLRSQDVFCWYLPVFDQSLPEYGPEYQPRLFRNDPNLNYIGTVYDHPYNSLFEYSRKSGLKFGKSMVPISLESFKKSPALTHYEDIELFKLLQLDIESYPDDPVLNCQLATTLYDHGQFEAAGEYFNKALVCYIKVFDWYFNSPIYEKIVTGFANLLYIIKDFENLRDLLGLKLFSNQELTDSMEYLLGLSFIEEENFQKAIEHLKNSVAQNGNNNWTRKIYPVANNYHEKVLSSVTDLRTKQINMTEAFH